jgi:hypothetical protein
MCEPWGITICGSCLRKMPMSIPNVADSKRSAGRNTTSIKCGSISLSEMASRSKLQLGVHSSSADNVPSPMGVSTRDTSVKESAVPVLPLPLLEALVLAPKLPLPLLWL